MCIFAGPYFCNFCSYPRLQICTVLPLLHQKRNSWLPSFQTMCRAIKAVLGDRNEAPKTPNSEFYSPFPDSSLPLKGRWEGWSLAPCCKFFARQGLQRQFICHFYRRCQSFCASVLYCPFSSSKFFSNVNPFELLTFMGKEKSLVTLRPVFKILKGRQW
jgi:hypothetical protein